MKKLLLCVFALSLSFGSQANMNKKKCVFQDVQLGEIMSNEGPFKNITKDDVKVGIPKIFKDYEKELGEWSVKDCKKAVLKTKVVSFLDHQVYTFYFTHEDECDGGNSYGLILGTKEQSPNKDKVVATITDGYIDCL